MPSAARGEAEEILGVAGVVGEPHRYIEVDAQEELKLQGVELAELDATNLGPASFEIIENWKAQKCDKNRNGPASVSVESVFQVLGCNHCRDKEKSLKRVRIQ